MRSTPWRWSGWGGGGPATAGPYGGCVVVVLLLMVVACGGQGAPAGPAPTPMNTALRAELELLGREDQAAREGFGAAAAGNDTAYMHRLLRGDSARVARLKQIVGTHGWPGKSLVGEEAAGAAWLILQHTDDVAWQASMLPVLLDLAKAGEVQLSEVALRTDRVLVRQGLPQRYGNSFSVKDGVLVADPIEDLPGLDARRREMGLPPMREYVKALGEAFKLPVQWPVHP